MKIFCWMQSKFSAKQGTKKINSVSTNNHMLQQPCKEEFSDWPHGVLAIGTFGNNNVKEDPETLQEACEDHQQDIAPEEVGVLHKELKQILDKLETQNLPLEKFFDSETIFDNLGNKDSTLQSSTSVVLDRGKDICLDNKNKAIGKSSLSFLLKKIFICRSGFAPTPRLRDSLTESRMEKICRAILHKKVYPQSYSSKATTKKYLDNKSKSMTDNEDEMLEKANDGSKWVKTDSEYTTM